MFKVQWLGNTPSIVDEKGEVVCVMIQQQYSEVISHALNAHFSPTEEPKSWMEDIPLDHNSEAVDFFRPKPIIQDEERGECANCHKQVEIPGAPLCNACTDMVNDPEWEYPVGGCDEDDPELDDFNQGHPYAEEDEGIGNLITEVEGIPTNLDILEHIEAENASLISRPEPVYCQGCGCIDWRCTCNTTIPIK